jgi:glyoxylase I family protein
MAWDPSRWDSERAEHWRFTGEADPWSRSRRVGSITFGLTVTNLERSRQFYTGLLGFEVAVEWPPAGDPSAAETFKILFGGIVMARGNLVMGPRPMAPSGDCFDPDRVGLDHLSFSVASHDDLEQAMRLFDERGVPHGEITSLPSFGIDVLPFGDPDGVQLELTAPMARTAARADAGCRGLPARVAVDIAAAPNAESAPLH